MFQPQLRRYNTVGVRYIQGLRRDEHYEEIIENILKIPEDEVAGLAERGDKQMMIKVTSKERYDEICYSYLHQKFLVASGCEIQVMDLSCKTTENTF